ncbi:MAG: hypothetical protein JO192_01850 [Candidatus Eremiobacteraeota bacterium]|nr:hypothetical protein [Candidatus Eremiobacteraeota bacterium]
MRSWPPGVAVALALLCGAVPVNSATSGVHCGTARWDVKTLADPAAKTLTTAVVPTTIDDLSVLKPPANPNSLPDRIAPVETTLWSVRARLLAYWVESDSDYHLLLADPHSGKTFYGEIPSPDCVQSRQSTYTRERAYVDALGGHAAPIVTVAGYGFFDHVRGFPDVGQAPNGIEIHPALRIAR